MGCDTPSSDFALTLIREIQKINSESIAAGGDINLPSVVMFLDSALRNEVDRPKVLLVISDLVTRAACGCCPPHP